MLIAASAFDERRGLLLLFSRLKQHCRCAGFALERQGCFPIFLSFTNCINATT